MSQFSTPRVDFHKNRFSKQIPTRGTLRKQEADVIKLWVQGGGFGGGCLGFPPRRLGLWSWRIMSSWGNDMSIYMALARFSNQPRALFRAHADDHWPPSALPRLFDVQKIKMNDPEEIIEEPLVPLGRDCYHAILQWQMQTAASIVIRPLRWAQKFCTYISIYV